MKKLICRSFDKPVRPDSNGKSIGLMEASQNIDRVGEIKREQNIIKLNSKQ